MWSRVKRRVSWVGFFWLGLVGFGLGVLEGKLHKYWHWIPGPSVFSFKSGVTFHSSGYGIGHVYSPSFSTESDFCPAVISTPHGRHIRSIFISVGGFCRAKHILSQILHIFFWDVIGSEWVIAIEF